MQLSDLPMNVIQQHLQTHNLTAVNYNSEMDEPVVKEMNARLPSLGELSKFIDEKAKQGIL